MVGEIFDILGQIIYVFTDAIPVKPFPGVDPDLGKILVSAFLLPVFFTWPGIELLAYIVPVSESLAFLQAVGAWILFLLFFSATLFWLLLKGLFI
jgi:hypothetical protein